MSSSPDFTTHADPRFKGSSCRHSWYLPLHPWITKIVRRVMLNLAALSLLTPTSSTSPDPFLVNMVNLVPTSDGLCGNFALMLRNPQRTPGCLLKQPYFPWHTLEGFFLKKKPVEVKITQKWIVSISAHRHRVPCSRKAKVKELPPSIGCSVSRGTSKNMKPVRRIVSR